ncbi:26S proteasome regulatory subunit T1 [Nematocida homosporus]|uniref:26S proteasome regulatory subunit T1 n=1 Tax=Nematocida homosporus TaxID=1912981 RepID=UPI00221FD24D|nr:26S proteasome regulatory subunit T1 [Nematocida homosporus]KAI5185602.1 26S proteasome regulatory subunit T1 [Nematocida homosporus]
MRQEAPEQTPLDSSLSEHEIQLIMNYGKSFYADGITAIEKEVKGLYERVCAKLGLREAETGLAPPMLWNLYSDNQRSKTEKTLQVARCCKVMESPVEANDRYMISVKQIAKFIVNRNKGLARSDLAEGMRVGVDRVKYQIMLPLPPKIDNAITLMQIEEKPDVTYSDIGGCVEQIEKIKEVVELPLMAPERFIKLGIDPPKGVLLYGPPGTGKTLCARAVANRADAAFIRVIGSELVQKYVGEGARMVREIFELAKSKKACIIFFDEVDAFGSTRFDGGSNEVQRTMLELINQLDGFDSRGNVKVLMATNRPDTLDPALLRPGRLDRKVEFSLPDLSGRAAILKIHTKPMSVEKNIRYELIARLCPSATGAELRSVCTEAGMFAIRERRKVATEKDFLQAVDKVIKGYAKFSSTPRYLTYN